MVPVKGHQAYEIWLGERVLTLEDVLPAEPLVVCVGINPSPTSVAIGHYYQGSLGQRFFSRLRQAELIDEAGAGFEDDAAVLRVLDDVDERIFDERGGGDFHGLIEVPPIDRFDNEVVFAHTLFQKRREKPVVGKLRQIEPSHPDLAAIFAFAGV